MRKSVATQPILGTFPELAPQPAERVSVSARIAAKAPFLGLAQQPIPRFFIDAASGNIVTLAPSQCYLLKR